MREMLQDMQSMPKHVHYDYKGMQPKERMNRADWDEISPQKRQALQQLRIEDKIEAISARYDLSKDEQNKVRQILEKRSEQLRKVRDESRAELDKILSKKARKANRT
jgi:hypothetical protein